MFKRILCVGLPVVPPSLQINKYRRVVTGKILKAKLIKNNRMYKRFCHIKTISQVEGFNPI